jgi:hypothetical protein
MYEHELYESYDHLLKRAWHYNVSLGFAVETSVYQ